MMQGYIVDVFTDTQFRGNRAGVVLLDDCFPEEVSMQSLASELNCSETAFVLPISDSEFSIRYFTPNSEIEFCGHATVGSFELLRQRRNLGCGSYSLHTTTSIFSVEITPDLVFVEVGDCRVIRELTYNQSDEIYATFGSSADEAKPDDLDVAIVRSGLSDIMLPVRSVEQLNSLSFDKERLIELSKKYSVVGVHAYALGEECLAHCRNFAPLYAIDEECATGSASCGLTTYLLQVGVVELGVCNRLVQGEAMGNPCNITTTQTSLSSVKVGGSAVVSIEFIVC